MSQPKAIYIGGIFDDDRIVSIMHRANRECGFEQGRIVIMRKVPAHVCMQVRIPIGFAVVAVTKPGEYDELWSRYNRYMKQEFGPVPEEWPGADLYDKPYPDPTDDWHKDKDYQDLTEYLDLERPDDDRG